MSTKTIILDKEESHFKKAHISEKKKEEVTKLVKLFNEYDTIALVDLTGLPSPQLQTMRKKIEKYAVIRVSKKRLIKKSLENIKKNNINELSKHLEEIAPAIIFSKESAFKLASLIRKNKSKVAAKAGQKAPRDILISAGPTPFTPGPIIGELGSLGIKAAVEGGKIVVREDCIVVREGKEINSKVANLLVKLDIKPMEIGLNLVAAYENGIILGKDVLEFDETSYINKIKEIALNAFKLTVSIGYATKDNIKFLIMKAENEAKAVSKIAGIKAE